MKKNLNGALQTLRHIMGDACETFTSGLGSCYEEGRTPGARYSAERCCVNCVAHRYLTCGEVPREERDIELKCDVSGREEKRDHGGAPASKRRSGESKNKLIDKVLAEFASEVSTKTKGRIVIKTGVFFDIGGEAVLHADDGDPVKFEAIYATSQHEEGGEVNDFCVLAEVWRKTENALCIVNFEGCEYICGDEVGMLRSLRSMYSSIPVRNKVKHLLNPEEFRRSESWRRRPS